MAGRWFKNKWLKRGLAGFGVCVVFVAITLAWIYSLVDFELPAINELAQTESLPYLKGAVTENRGRILAVVTSHNVMGDSGHKTGYELTELSRAYYVFKANGFEVDFASPLGGTPPVVIDDGLNDFDYAFLNDEKIQEKLNNSLRLSDVDPDLYAAVYFVGGKGTMWDFVADDSIQNLVKTMYQDDKIISAVCHGPAALVEVKLDNGEYLVAGKRMTGFSNQEELTIIRDAREIFPFLLEDGLQAKGAQYISGPTYLNNVVTDGQLITGQNPWSVWELSEEIIRGLGYEPIPRKLTGEELAGQVVEHYHADGVKAALAHWNSLEASSGEKVPSNFVLLHGVVAAMQFRVDKAFGLLWLIESKA
jgi:putative intracellular protease/amidase